MTPLLQATRPRSPVVAPPKVTEPRVGILGLGYVGLPTALQVHASGLKVLGIDISSARLGAIESSSVDLLPSELERLRAALEDDRWILAGECALLTHADVILICVPTPLNHADRTPDLRPLEAACASVVEHARAGQTIVLTSTTSIGSTRRLLVDPLAQRGMAVGEEVHVAFAPERIWPGVAEHQQHTVPRVLGGLTLECAESAAEVLGRVAASLHIVSSLEAAEACKLHENTFRAVNLAWVNEMADAYRTLGLDPIEIIEAAASKPYGFMPHYPGPGVGGHCIGVDPEYLLADFAVSGASAPITTEAMAGIARRPHQVASRALGLLEQADVTAPGSNVLMIGVAFKPGVQDTRDSTAVEIITDLRSAGCNVAYHDPLVDALRVDGVTLLNVTPDPSRYDLVILHTIHQQTDLSWLDDAGVVLDCTYRHAGERI
jgi:UDP-N-acetyl-D-glucosamine dehydrogenase